MKPCGHILTFRIITPGKEPVYVVQSMKATVFPMYFLNAANSAKAKAFLAVQTNCWAKDLHKYRLDLPFPNWTPSSHYNPIYQDL